MFQTVRSLLMSLNSAAAEDMQTILTVAENLHASLINEMERVKQALKQYDELSHRYQEALKSWSIDKNKIRSQRDEIGMQIQFKKKKNFRRN